MGERGIRVPDTFTICGLACGRMLPWPSPLQYQHLARVVPNGRGTFDVDVAACMDAMSAEIEATIEAHMREHDRLDW